MVFLGGIDSQELFIYMETAVEEIFTAAVVIHKDAAILRHMYHPIFK